jgi:hypothetical protein
MLCELKKIALLQLLDITCKRAITKKINGGLNGFEDRKKYLVKAKKIVPQDISFVKEEKEEVLPPLVAIENAVASVTEQIKTEAVETVQETVVPKVSLLALFIMFIKAIFSKKER